MKKALKWIITLFVPLLLLMGAAWISSHASYSFTDHFLPTFSDWQYWVRILLYGAVAVYLLYLYQSKYPRKEFLVLVIPIIYLIFFSLPMGLLGNNETVMTFLGKFYAGYNIQIILLFAYLVKTVATALTWAKDSKQQEKESLSAPPVMEEKVFE